MSSSPLVSALIVKLNAFSPLTAADIEALEALPVNGKHYRSQQRIVSDGDSPSEVCLIINGFAYRSKMIADGRRQILSIHMPGEIPDLQCIHLPVMDHDVTALSECTLGFVPHDAIRELTRSRPTLADILWRDSLVDAALLREGIVSLGRRSALERLSHLLLEIFYRLRPLGRVRGTSFTLPLTQSEIGDCLGISSVHVNRVVQQLRTGGLIATAGREIDLLDIGRLEEIARFDLTYLHQAVPREDA